jgi:Glyoxalase-like domain
MTVGIQISFDAHDPLALGRFWAQALGYVDQPPPPGFDSWDAFLDSAGVPAGERDRVWAVVDPDGVRPRLLFQRVPEDKTAKNRVHLDVKIDADVPAEQRPQAVRERVAQLVELGATRLHEAAELGVFWIVMQDPEGNEFCVS